MDAPWSSKETLETKDGLERLSKEILDFEKYIEPTKEEQLNRDTLLYQVSRLVESLWPNNTVITSFGSSVTGLAFPASDVDINIDFDELPKKNKIDVLKIIRKQTINQKIFQFQTTNLAAKAKVPVLMAVDENDVSMDITIQNACFSSDRTATWVKQYPPLKPLFMVLKQSIGNFRLSATPSFEPLSAKFAGLASYSLICLIVSYLQLSVPEDVDPKSAGYLGSLLIGFLSFYSTFESDRMAIDLKDGGKFYNKKDCPIPLETKKGKLTIVDPDVPDANVARSTLKFDKVQLLFGHVFQLLFKRLSSSSKCESILSSIVKVEHHDYRDPRKQGTRFKSCQTWIENGSPSEKMSRQRFGAKRGMPYEQPERRGGYKRDAYASERYEDSFQQNNSYQLRDSYQQRNNYQQQNSYRAEPYTKRYNQQDDHNAREYQRHKRNNNSHLAEHYKHKSERSRR